jgi:hypothetical protein
MFGTLAVISLVLFSGVSLESKFRDTINFEDNNFVKISNVDQLHGYRHVDGDDYNESRFNYQMTGGLMTNLELGVRVPVRFFNNGTQNFGDISIFERFKFTQESESLPESSAGIELFLPTGDDQSDPSTGTDEFSARLYSSVGKSIDSDLRWIAHGGVTLMGNDDYDNEWEYNAALRYQSNPYMKVVGELNGRTGGLRDDSELFASPGVLFQSEEGFNVMASLPVGVTSESADFKPTLQFAYEF